MRRTPLVTLKQYDVTITQSWETNHGISGHLFEMIEYFYHFTFHKKIKTSILLADGITIDQFKVALDKYDFSPREYTTIITNTFFKFQPRVIIANDVIFVDGSIRTFNADLLCKRKIFLRCSEDEYLDKADIVLQDYDLYEPLPNSIDYKKKMLFSKFKKIGKSEDKAMFYATGNSRMLSFEDLEHLTAKHCFYKYIILSNKEIETPSNVELLKVPVQDLWTKFNTYIYTGLTNLTKIDCSSRFIAECQHYGKQVIYDVQRVDKGLEVRRKDLHEGLDKISLKETDDILSKITII